MTLKNNRFKWIFIVVFVMLGLLFFVNGYFKNKSEYTVANNVEVLSTKIMNRISTTDLPTFHLAVSGKQGELYYLLKSNNYIAELKKGDKVKLIKGYLVPYSGFMAIFLYKNKEYFWYEREIFTDKDIEKIHNQYDPTPLEAYFEKFIVHDSDSGGTGTVTDIDGNVYQTMVIGDQEWMIENLKVTHYRNGDPIPHLSDGDDWTSTFSGAYCYYDNDPTNGDTCGALYNWYAVGDSRELAPEGWHVPADDEIQELEMYLGMSRSEADDTGWRGTNEGSKLAGGYDLWGNGDLRNDPEFDTSGFSFLPGGYRSSHSGAFFSMSGRGSFWSSTEYYSYVAWLRGLHCTNTAVYRNYDGKQGGFSVRCVRD